MKKYYRKRKTKYQKKMTIKKILEGTAVVMVQCMLVVAVAAVFISVFQWQDARRVSRKPAADVPITASRAAPDSSTPSLVSSSSLDSSMDSEPSSSPVSSDPASSSSDSSEGDSSSSALAVNQEQLDDWQLVLVNYDHKMPDNYVHTIVHQLGIDIDSRLLQPYLKMRDAAAKDKISLWISSAYRSPEKQAVLFEEEIKTYSKTGLDYVDAVAKAEKSVARPGYSEHNSGLAVDLNGVKEDFDGTPASEWLKKHAAEYGFVLRYPEDKQEITKIKFEPWHYRYVGVEHAKEMTSRNLCLEEYIDYLKKNPSSAD